MNILKKPSTERLVTKALYIIPDLEDIIEDIKNTSETTFKKITITYSDEFHALNYVPYNEYEVKNNNTDEILDLISRDLCRFCTNKFCEISALIQYEK